MPLATWVISDNFQISLEPQFLALPLAIWIEDFGDGTVATALCVLCFQFKFIAFGEGYE